MSNRHPETPPGIRPYEDLAVREQAVHERRLWVRTTYLCNNRCIFCLDGDRPGGGHRDEAEVMEEMRRGYGPDTRLILSGGEASIHPSFHRFLEYGRSLGFAWIQTISNGRMYAYPDFAKKAADAGLNEVTFSMHGHRAELHDALTGVRGAFAQALRGMINLLKGGRVVVNVDIVINGMNYKVLDEIIEFYMRLGIHEFDLLQMVPFGRAWYPENRGRLFYDVEEAFPYLNRAFKLAARPDNYVWTNRFPVAFLEGVEGLIQDPHKLFDELNGRRDEFDRFVRTGEKLRCFGERCQHCFICDYCHSLFTLRDRLVEGGFERLEIDLTGEESPPGGGVLEELLEKNSILGWRLHARDLDGAAGWLAAAPAIPGRGELRLDDWSDFLKRRKAGSLPPEFSGVELLVTEDPGTFDALESLPYALEARLTRAMAEMVGPRRESLVKRGAFYLAMPSVETLTEAHQCLPEPSAVLKDWLKLPVNVRGVPACLHPNAVTDGPTLRLSALDSEGLISMLGYTRDYIRYDYLVKSNRCRACVYDDTCRGLQINTLRVHGFGQLQPIAGN